MFEDVKAIPVVYLLVLQLKAFELSMWNSPNIQWPILPDPKDHTQRLLVGQKHKTTSYFDPKN
ncbi:hypothetical protein ABES02_10230 [Neobacillus pocheonensis]|uniref:hypothetical protein n=1 Tax=Neobacillus pocheonensis TaxID=363869 RepID=UPI003D2E89CA